VLGSAVVDACHPRAQNGGRLGFPTKF